MKLKVNLLGVFLLVSLLAASIHMPALAQDPPPPTPLVPADPGAQPGPTLSGYKAKNGMWVQKSNVDSNRIAPLSSGGPDLFGYVWDDSVGYSWIDATPGGTVVSFPSSYRYSGAIGLPFPFKYYENTYNSFYINPNGHLGFADSSSDKQGSLLTPSSPNNIIAPLWTPISLATSGATNRVYYKLFGTGSNRYMVVEWYQVKGDNNPDLLLTFEVILYENGNIKFQYQTISGTTMLYCASTGIEDSIGYDGLVLLDFCGWDLSISSAILFTRPGPGARLNAYPRNLGLPLGPNGKVEFQFTMRNTGALGADTYELTATMAPGWQVTLFGENQNRLVDTNGNFDVDTGSVAQGQSLVIKAVISRNAVISNIGDYNPVNLTITSSVNPSKHANVQFQVSVPPTFGQIYRDDANGATSLDLVSNTGTITVKTSPNNWSGDYLATTTAPNGNLLTAWLKQRCIDPACNISVSEVEYAINGPDGNSLRGVTKLTDYSASSNDIQNFDLTAAAAPNGQIGLAWYQRQYNNQGNHLCNVYSAVLDSAGTLVAGPTNLTNQTTWGGWGVNNIPCFSEIRLAATGDNHFVTSYQNEYSTSSGYLDDIYTTVQESNGALIQGPAKRTVDTPGWDKGYSYPNLIPLSNQQVLLLFSADPEYDLMGMILDSSGGVAKNTFNITNDGSLSYEWMPDGILLPNGKILIGWWSNGVTYALLDPVLNYATVSGPTHLAIPYTFKWSHYVSVTSDAASHGIISWENYMSGFSPNLYYAVVNGDGSILLNTTILRSANLQNGNQFITTSDAGSGNTTLLQPTPAQGIDLYVSPAPITPGIPGKTASFMINLGSMGLISTEGTLTVNLGPDVSLFGASQPPSSSVGNIHTWDLSTMNYHATGQVYLIVSLPSDAINGTLLPIQLSVQPTVGIDDNPANDSVTVYVIVLGKHVFLPFIRR